MRGRRVLVATVALVLVAGIASGPPAPAAAQKGKRCKAGQVVVKTTIGKGKGKKRGRLCVRRRAKAIDTSAALRARARAVVKRSRYRAVLATRVARRLDAGQKRSERLIGRPTFVFPRATAADVRTDTINTTTIVSDTGRSRVVKTVEGEGTSDDGQDVAKDVTTTVTQIDRDTQDGQDLTATRKHTQRTAFSTDACPSASGVVKGFAQLEESQTNSYASPDGGRVVMRTYSSARIDVTGQVGDDATYSGFDYRLVLKTERSVRRTNDAGRVTATLSDDTGTASDAGSAPNVAVLAELVVNRPSVSATTAIAASEVMTHFASIEAQLVRRELATKFKLREGAWLGAERCAKLDASPASLTLEPGQAGSSQVRLTIEGAPLAKPIKVVSTSGPVQVSPSGGGPGPELGLTLTLSARAAASVTLESVSNRGRGFETISIAPTQPEEPPPAELPAAFNGTIDGRRTTSNPGNVQVVHMTGSIRFVRGGVPGNPPGGYTLQSGTGTLSYELTSDTGCDASGSTPVDYAPSQFGPNGSLGLSGSAPPYGYTFGVQLPPDASVVATRSSCPDPNQNGTTTTVPLAGAVGVATRSPQTGSANGALTGSDSYTETNGQSTQTTQASWNLIPGS